MKSLYVSEVGDGLCSLFKTKFNINVQLDCGGSNQDQACKGFERIIYRFGKPNQFILSHFHLDHYTGLFSPNLFGRFEIQKAYFPNLPKFPENEEFFRDLIVLELIVYGATGNPIEYDFLEAISRLNHNRTIEYQPLYEGVELNINGTKMEVLSPPLYITDKFFTKKIKKLISRFEELKEKDDELRERYDDVYKSEMVWRYKNVQGGKYERNDRYEEYRRDDTEGLFENKVRIRDEVKHLNAEFRDVANRLSVAFKINNDFLFLGDLEKRELKRVIKKLSNYYKYIILLNPHHGTHWQKNMNKLNVDYSISSIGHQRISFFNQRFKTISKTTLSTYCNGNIYLQTSYWPNPLIKYYMHPLFI